MYQVLYVDDEENLLEIGKYFLEKRGEFSVDTCLSAAEATQMMLHREYDAVVSDYMMPELNGIEFLQQLRLSSNDVPFVLFTGRGREEVVIQAIDSGADFYLQKGGDPGSQYAELAHKIKISVKKRRAERAIRETEDNYLLFFMNSPEAVLIYDVEGTILFANYKAAKTIGIEDPAALYGQYVIDFIDLTSEWGDISDNKWVVESRNGNPAPGLLRTAGGEEIHVNCIGYFINYRGDPANLVTIRTLEKKDLNSF